MTETVERGQVLLVREEAHEDAGLPVRYRLWTVASVRGKSVKLIGYAPGVKMEATATFPDGIVAEPWQVFALSQADLAHVWARDPRSQSEPEA